MFPKSVPGSLLLEAHRVLNRNNPRTASLKETYAGYGLEALFTMRHRRRVKLAAFERALVADPCMIGAMTVVHGHQILASVKAEIQRRVGLLRHREDVRLGRRKVAIAAGEDDDSADDDVSDDLDSEDEGDEETLNVTPLDPKSAIPLTPAREEFFASVKDDVEKLVAGRARRFVNDHPGVIGADRSLEDIEQDLHAAVWSAWMSFKLPTEGNARAAFFGFLSKPGEKGEKGEKEKDSVGVIDGVLNNLLRKEVPRAQRRDDNRTGESAAGEVGETDDEGYVHPGERVDSDVPGTGISGDRFAPTDASDRERAQQDLYIYADKESWPLLDLIFDAPELQNLPESKWLKRFFALAQERLQLSPYEVRKILREDSAVAEFLGSKFDALEEESPEERADRKTRDEARGERLDIKKRPKTSTFDRRRLI